MFFFLTIKNFDLIHFSFPLWPFRLDGVAEQTNAFFFSVVYQIEDLATPKVFDFSLIGLFLFSQPNNCFLHLDQHLYPMHFVKLQNQRYKSVLPLDFDYLIYAVFQTSQKSELRSDITPELSVIQLEKTVKTGCLMHGFLVR